VKKILIVEYIQNFRFENNYSRIVNYSILLRMRLSFVKLS